jgi:glucan phosphoethanolaminetransferase (alkaline phosphatase superfamily)
MLPAIAVALNRHEILEVGQITIILSTSLCSVLLLVSLYGWAPRFAGVLMGVFAVIAMAEILFIHEYGWPFDANTISVLIETSRAESSDFASSLLMGAGLCIGLPLVLTVGAYSRTPLSMPEGSKKRLITGSLLTWMAVVAVAAWFIPVSPTVSTTADPFPAEQTGQALALRAGYPAGLPWVFYDLIVERESLQAEVARHKTFHFSVKPPPPVSHRRFYVLVIGESSRGDHWGLNGYGRDTTPELSKRDDLISFRRMYTPWTYTRLAVPMMISRKPPTLELAVFPENSILTVFKQAGFHTAWISLQAAIGHHDAPIAMDAAEADESHFLNPLDYRYHGNHDDAAIAALQRLIDAPDQPDTFVVVHLLGSHFRYTDRYPRSFAHFQPDNPDSGLAELFNSNDKQVLINGYDNSIRFTDHVLNSFIGELEKRNDMESWLLYSSDHGESLFDDCRMQSGHGMTSHATQLVSALFWASPLYKMQNSVKVSTMLSHENTLASTAMFFETMSDLSSIQVAGNRKDNSLASVPLRNPLEVANAEKPYVCPVSNH